MSKNICFPEFRKNISKCCWRWMARQSPASSSLKLTRVRQTSELNVKTRHRSTLWIVMDFVLWSSTAFLCVVSILDPSRLYKYSSEWKYKLKMRFLPDIHLLMLIYKYKISDGFQRQNDCLNRETWKRWYKIDLFVFI